MIPINIDDNDVLRRTLLELEESIPALDIPLTPIEELPVNADVSLTVGKVNEIIRSVNALYTSLNSKAKHRI